jgi:hypothetical protein
MGRTSSREPSKLLKPMTAPATAPTDGLNRVLALIPLAALAVLWSNHHLGTAAGYPGLFAALAAALPVALGLFDRLLDKASQESFAARWREAVARWLSWRAIVIGYLSAALVALAWSSLVVLGDDAGATSPASVRLTPFDAPDDAATRTLLPRGEPARFVVTSSPFGRVFRLEVDGYVPETVEIYPVLGRRISPARDLRRSPTVLLRLSQLALGSFQDQTGGELVITRIMAGNPAGEVVARTKQQRAAFLLGRAQRVPAGFAAGWRIELLARGVRDETLAAKHLVSWKEPAVLAPSVVLEPGMPLRAQLFNAAGNVVASSDFILGNDELQDQSVEDLP